MIKKINYIRSFGYDDDVFNYLKERFEGLTIEVPVLKFEVGKVLDLMENGHLEGWCWQTTETCSVFLDDFDYIERGNLKYNDGNSFREGRDKKYYHSWICFKHNNIEYVFDHCFGIICEKPLYILTFDADVLGRVTAYSVKQDLLRRIGENSKKTKKEDDSFISRFLREKCGDYLDSIRDDTHIVGDDNVFSPMYRNNTRYRAEIESGKVKKLLAHYYLNG